MEERHQRWAHEREGGVAKIAHELSARLVVGEPGLGRLEHRLQDPVHEGGAHGRSLQSSSEAVGHHGAEPMAPADNVHAQQPPNGRAQRELWMGGAGQGHPAITLAAELLDGRPHQAIAITEVVL
jgi:hypothetical protein